MKNFTKWASKEYSFAQRLLGTLPAGILFALLIPYTLVKLVPRLDSVVPSAASILRKRKSYSGLHPHPCGINVCVLVHHLAVYSGQRHTTSNNGNPEAAGQRPLQPMPEPDGVRYHPAVCWHQHPGRVRVIPGGCLAIRRPAAYLYQAY